MSDRGESIVRILTINLRELEQSELKMHEYDCFKPEVL
jgi:hypothetical protein